VQNQGYRGNIKLKQQTLYLVIKMGFFDEIDQSSIVDTL